jgi:hypothetical protein
MLTLIVGKVAIFPLEEEVPKTNIWDLEGRICRVGWHVGDLLSICRCVTKNKQSQCSSMQYLSKTSCSNRTAAEEEMNDIILLVDHEAAATEVPECKGVHYLEPRPMVSAYSRYEESRPRVSLKLRHRALTFILLLHAKRQHGGERLCSMRTVLLVKSEHMELTRRSLIACEMASYFFHVSECITHVFEDTADV